jgi:predicted metal-dependent phosphotriesterase family hydrolase
MQAMGVSQADLDHIVTDNPRRFFEAGQVTQPTQG